jgi:glycosyltransferase involved in cell wall biosynthesis
MRILLLGEYSNVHWTLSEGLKALGHDVCVISDGDSWKNYQRDITLKRHSTSKLDTIRYLIDIARTLHKMKGFDVVQLINPIFLDLKADKIRPFYKYLRKHNKKVFLGAFGMDYYWVKTCLDCSTFRYSDFNIGKRQRTEEASNQQHIKEWLHGDKGKLNKYIAEDCDGIISGLYEYDCCYRPYFPKKTKFIPFPINISQINKKLPHADYPGIRFFIGVQRTRSSYKGTDIMLRALEKLKAKYPDKMEIVKVESVPFATYQNLMNTSDILLDQLYSYTPSMNSLLAMAKGIVIVGGGEEESYEILNEKNLRPIINVIPNEEDVYIQLEKVIKGEYDIKKMSSDSIEYIKRYHDHIKIAKQYIDFWNEDD